MKKILISIACIVSVVTCFSQSEKYTKAMANNISQIDSAKSNEDMLSLSASFERIGDAEKTQWLPYYYSAFCELLYAFKKNDLPNNDQYADKANTLLSKAEALEKNNSEISVLKSMVATLHMMVDPANRWQQYGGTITSAIENAKKEDPNNPRPWYLQGQNLRYTPENFGGGCGPAKPVLEEAIKKFDSFKPASSLHPNWGKSLTEQTLAGCK
jgi:hypothetical protein